MLTSSFAMPAGISLRPATAGDQAFLQTLYRSARPDLQFIDGAPEFVETVVAQQYAVHAQGTGEEYPNAMHFIIEKTQAAVGALVVDFGHNEVRVIYVAFILAARGFGYGKAVLRGVQQAAAKVQCPVAVVVWHNNPGARRIYLELGFQVEESQLMADRMVWYPGKPG
ncbi:GNAT family N-acetyltransferase [Collimonas sp.]|jgi:ribosomal protein S18 acetylase RimI-like enzyme|uniref:GNAT family N-acetyltransferase n=1 Tax=Collimonas sp. TaxID=1963772 RepID=UPI002CEF6E35|nr:GNAT family N-acetyltransferase [Collimonas sp.]HWW04667.1 GNAT family N-acetyltransferase [Collimonas sp.]